MLHSYGAARSLFLDFRSKLVKGMELTGNVAQILMMWYDRELARIMNEGGLEVLMFKRYVDDINMAFKVPDDAENDIEPGSLDAHWMSKVKDWGNQIHQSIGIKVDYPSLHEDLKMPILDLKVWIKEREGNQKIVVHEYYYKEVATKTMLHARAAMPHSMKRTTLTQELLRVMLRCSP